MYFSSMLFLLIRLLEFGNFTLKFEANYKVLRNEIYDDYSIFTYSENIQIESIPAVTSKHEFHLDNYFIGQNQNMFPTQKDIKFKLKLENKIDTNIQIKKMEIISPNQDIKIISQFSKLIENHNLPDILNENLSVLRNNSEINIPFTLNSSKNFIGIVGKVIFHWIDKRNNNDNLVNVFEIILPDIEIKRNDIEISYTTSDIITGKNTIDLVVKIRNNSKEFKRITFIIDNSFNFMITGPVKKKVLIYPNDFKELAFSLIPLYYGSLKLPPFKVIEDIINPSSNISEGDKKSIYFVPDMINITENLGN